MDGGGGYTSRGGLSARPGPGARPQDHVQISVEKFDYEAQLSDLRGDVARIKQLAYAIDEERKLGAAEIDSLEDAMERARMAVGNAMRRLGAVSKQARSYLLLWVVLFAVGFFLLVVFVKKLMRLGRFFGLR